MTGRLVFALAAGGTGGHLFPAEALAAELDGRGHAVHLITDARGKQYATAFLPGHVHQVASETLRAKTPGALFANANLGAIADNGGLTETMALTAASPAFNAGTASGALPTDQRGQPRWGAVDIGAYELQADLIFASGFD